MKNSLNDNDRDSHRPATSAAAGPQLDDGGDGAYDEPRLKRRPKRAAASEIVAPKNYNDVSVSGDASTDHAVTVTSNKKRRQITRPPPPTCQIIQYKRGRPICSCSVRGATNLSVGDGLCHGYGIIIPSKKRCNIPGCSHVSRVGGVCISHGAKVKNCKAPGCNRFIQNNGLCKQHGAVRRSCKDLPELNVKAPKKKCSHDGCVNQAVRCGVCIRHGAKNATLLTCGHKGCAEYASWRGFCGKHYDSEYEFVGGQKSQPSSFPVRSEYESENGLKEQKHVPNKRVRGITAGKKQEIELEENSRSKRRRCVPKRFVATPSKQGLSVQDIDAEIISSSTIPNGDIGDASRDEDNMHGKTHAYKDNDGSTEQPSPEVLKWVRGMSDEKQCKNVARGVRVKVLFEGSTWYGGVIENVLKGGGKVNIKYDDGSEESSIFPDADIIIDDVSNGSHSVYAAAFSPHGGSGESSSDTELDTSPKIVASMVSSYCQPVNAPLTSNPLVAPAPTCSAKINETKLRPQVSYGAYDSEEEEELGVLIYQSSLKERLLAT